MLIKNRFSEEDIQTACGILEINAHEIRVASGYEARALYPFVSLMNHSCVSNTCHSVSPNDNRYLLKPYQLSSFFLFFFLILYFCLRAFLRTSVKVPAGEELFGTYTHSLLPTLLRRESLLETKHFSCACVRCSDPTELNTHLSTLKCNKCDNGVVLPEDSLGKQKFELFCSTKN